MYEYIKGIYEESSTNYVVVEAGGIGYRIYTTAYTMAKMPEKGKSVKLYTYLNVKEDGVELYGFYSKDELLMYELVTSVSGVGPKLGIAILSTVSPSDFAAAVVREDKKAITSAPGVGPKLAGRIILELKDKMGKQDIEMPLSESVPVTLSSSAAEAAQALMALGYSAAEAERVTAGEDGTVEEIIAKALKKTR